MEDESVYFGVECRNCQARLPLIELESGAQAGCWTIPNVKPFSVACPHCQGRERYKARHVIVFAGPPPGGSFVVHPAFRNV